MDVDVDQRRVDREEERPVARQLARGGAYRPLDDRVCNGAPIDEGGDVVAPLPGLPPALQAQMAGLRNLKR